MSVQLVLLPVFVLVGLTFALLLVSSRRGALSGGETTLTPQSELPLLFYTLIALAFIVLLSWVSVVACFAPSRKFRNVDRRSAALYDLTCGRACAFRDVALLRAKDSLDLIERHEPQGTSNLS